MACLQIDTATDQSEWLPPYLVACFVSHSQWLNISIDLEKPKHGAGLKLTIDTTSAEYSSDAVLPVLIQLASQAGNAPFVVREWAARSKDVSKADFAALKTLCDDLDRHLTMRSFIWGHQLTVADVALWAAIRANKASKQVVTSSGSNISRWYKFITQEPSWLMSDLQEALSAASKAKTSQNPVGPNYELGDEFNGPQITRFPPEPSGYLHVGHGKAALMNEYFARKHPGGTLICRFDDTNPSKESREFQESILQDLKLIEIVPDRVTYSSDYFEAMYQLALKLINDGKAFADDSELGKGNEDRKNRLPSKRRNMSIAETLERFAEMKTGSQEGQRWCLRARIEHDSLNGTLRDPVVYRCNPTPHHRTGTTWKMYPTYDFCAPILDSVEGVTLALRTNEYRDRNAQYEWFQTALTLRRVQIYDFSRLNFVRTVLSKRKLTKIVGMGKVWGWDDPRMPTIRGILRRGMTVAALREFILSQGLSRNVLNLEWGALWTLNKKKLDPVVPRYTAIAKAQIVKCRVSGGGSLMSAKRPKHAKNVELGSKDVFFGTSILLEQSDAITLEQDEEVTLMAWGNAIVHSISRAGPNRPVTDIVFNLHLEGDVKKTKKKLTWLADVKQNMIPVILYSFDHLITKDKLEPDDQLENFLTPVTQFPTEAYADCTVAGLAPGTHVQFERKGYYRLDTVAHATGSPMVFFEIPTGRKG